MNTEPIELAPEPAYGDVTWVSAYDVDPFTVSAADKVELLAQWSRALLAHPAVSHVDAALQQVRECKFYSDGETTATQQRVRLHPAVTAIAVSDDGRFDTMRTLAPPAAAAMSSSPEPAGTSTPSWPSCPSCSRPSWWRPRSSRAGTTW